MRYYDTLVIDMSYLLHRVLHAGSSKGEAAHQEMMTSGGTPTGGVYGVCKTLKSLLSREDLRVGDIVAVWDGPSRPRSPRRTSLLPVYKNKEEDPNLTEEEKLQSREFRALYNDQKPRINDLFRRLGVPVVVLEGREGDDVVAVVSSMLQGRVLVMSDDRDYWQMVSERTHVYRAIKDYILTPDNFAEKTELPTPFQYLICASITGDGSDNIPGIDGVGGTTAVKFAKAYPAQVFKYHLFMETVESLKQSDTRSRKRYEILRNNYNIVVRNMHLMNLSLETCTFTDYERDVIRSQYAAPRVFDPEDIMGLFMRYEFKSLLDDAFPYFLKPFYSRTAIGLK